LSKKVPHGTVVLVGVVGGMSVAVGTGVAVSVGVCVALRVSEGVEIGVDAFVAVAVPLACVGLLVGVDGHPFNAADTAWMRQSTVT